MKSCFLYKAFIFVLSFFTVYMHALEDDNISDEEKSSLSIQSFDINTFIILREQNIRALGLRNVDSNFSLCDVNITAIQTKDRNETLRRRKERSHRLESLVQKLKKEGYNLLEGLGVDEFFLTRKLLEKVFFTILNQESIIMKPMITVLITISILA